MQLDGWKTYLVAIATVAYALGGMVIGAIEPNVAIPMILAALGVSAFRHTTARVQTELRLIQEEVNGVKRATAAVLAEARASNALAAETALRVRAATEKLKQP